MLLVRWVGQCFEEIGIAAGSTGVAGAAMVAPSKVLASAQKKGSERLSVYSDSREEVRDVRARSRQISIQGYDHGAG